MHKKILSLLFISFIIHTSEAISSQLDTSVDEIESVAGGINGSINFYNVGNGHAAVITSEGRPPLICDAGTVAHGVIHRNKANIVAPIIADIQASFLTLDPVQYGNRLPLSICISHPSMDHFNLIRHILTRLPINEETPLLVHTMLGGERVNYQLRTGGHQYVEGQALLGALQAAHLGDVGEEEEDVNEEDYMRFSAGRHLNTPAEINWLLHRQNINAEEEEDVNWEGDPIITHFFGQTDLGIVPAGADANDQKSIVTRVSINNWSAVFQGDALRVNTDAIIGLGEQQEFEADILHASLQGGGVDRANQPTWIQHVNPRYGIFSAGQRGNPHFHPRAGVIKRFFFEGNRLFVAAHQHNIHLFNPNGVAIPHLYNVRNSQYGGVIKRTRYGVYTPFSSGNIRFNSQNIEPVTQYAALPGYL